MCMCSVRIQVNQIFTYVNLKTNQSKMPCTYFNTRVLYPLPNRSWKKLAYYVVIWNWALRWWHQLNALHVLILVYVSLVYRNLCKRGYGVLYSWQEWKGLVFVISIHTLLQHKTLYRQDAKTMTSQQRITLWRGNLTKESVMCFNGYSAWSLLVPFLPTEISFIYLMAPSWEIRRHFGF